MSLSHLHRASHLSTGSRAPALPCGENDRFGGHVQPASSGFSRLAPRSQPRRTPRCRGRVNNPSTALRCGLPLFAMGLHRFFFFVFCLFFSVEEEAGKSMSHSLGPHTWQMGPKKSFLPSFLPSSPPMSGRGVGGRLSTRRTGPGGCESAGHRHSRPGWRARNTCSLPSSL